MALPKKARASRPNRRVVGAGCPASTRLKDDAMKPAGVPSGFILFSEAVRRLQTTMWGGLPRPIALRNLRDLLRKEGSDTWVTIYTEDIRKTFGQEGLPCGPNICEIAVERQQKSRTGWIWTLAAESRGMPT